VAPGGAEASRIILTVCWTLPLTWAPGEAASGFSVAAELVDADQVQREVLDAVEQAIQPGVIADCPQGRETQLTGLSSPGKGRLAVLMDINRPRNTFMDPATMPEVTQNLAEVLGN
jgi:hypothetical protein